MADDKVYKVKFFARLSYAQLWKKTASTDGGKLAYRANFLIDPKTKQGKTAIGLIENCLDDLRADVWPKLTAEKFDRMIDPKRFPLMDGNDYIDRSGEIRLGYEDMMFVKANNEKRPKLRARDGTTDLEEADDKLYSGANVLAYLHFYPVTEQKRGGMGIFATIDCVQFVSDGERFGGGGIDDDEIENLGDDESEEGQSGSSSRRRGNIDDDEEEDKPSSRGNRSGSSSVRDRGGDSSSRSEGSSKSSRRSRDDDVI